jgi:hypothetical protein
VVFQSTLYLPTENKFTCAVSGTLIAQSREVGVFQFGGPNCKVCRLIRVYLLVAIPVLMMMWMRPNFQIPAGVDGRAVVGYAFGIGVVVMFAYKYYTDIYRKKRKND